MRTITGWLGLLGLPAGCNLVDQTEVPNYNEQVFTGKISRLHLDYGDQNGLHRSEEILQLIDDKQGVFTLPTAPPPAACSTKTFPRLISTK